MKTVRLFDLLSYDGQTWQVVAQDGPQLALKELVSGRIRKIGVAELGSAARSGDSFGHAA
ncbi:integrase family protein [Mycobacteroides abscessus subsp. massiliense]|uniref:hypothetical protein n=1 Tax=Mycobacteroides abscessus TaxID=36809 RepID=UPI0009CB1639|nr:hypothetical protein [Mycobacteroides abscessus]SLH51954.1 integrase family protein [Mycobacteroides abscessus subsp. massiliense]